MRREEKRKGKRIRDEKPKIKRRNDDGWSGGRGRGGNASDKQTEMKRRNTGLSSLLVNSLH